MNADLPRMGRMPAEGPTYRMRLGAAMGTLTTARASGATPDLVVVCGHPDHGEHQPYIAEVWRIGDEVVWRAEYPLESGTAETAALLDAVMGGVRSTADAHGIALPPWRAIFPNNLSVHLLNVPPADRVDCTEVPDRDADGNEVMAWHTDAWPGGADIRAHCPAHGDQRIDELVTLAALARGQHRLALT